VAKRGSPPKVCDYNRCLVARSPVRPSLSLTTTTSTTYYKDYDVEDCTQKLYLVLRPYVKLGAEQERL